LALLAFGLNRTLILRPSHSHVNDESSCTPENRASQGKRSLLSPRRDYGLMLRFFHNLPLPSLAVHSWKIEKII